MKYTKAEIGFIAGLILGGAIGISIMGISGAGKNSTITETLKTENCLTVYSGGREVKKLKANPPKFVYSGAASFTNAETGTDIAVSGTFIYEKCGEKR